ncbi:MAG: hypothetical protein H7Y88_08760 [Phycisphaerales bacterium]|nr:hypothetical protein [Phycisphaerales bacterium]
MAINLVNLMASEAAVVHLCELCQRSRRVIARGSAGSSAALLAGAVSVRTARPVLLVAAHLDEAEEALDELGSAGLSALRLPALEVLPGESNISLDLFAQRVAVVRRLSVAAQAQPGEKSASPQVIIAPVQALMQSVPDPAALGFLTLSLARAQRRDPAEIISWLERAGYQRMDAIEEPGDYAVRGGIIDIFPPGEAPNSSAAGAGGGGSGGAGLPIRMDFFGDEIDKLSEIDLDTMGSDRAIDSAQLVCASIEAVQAHEKFGSVSFLEVVPRDAIVLLHETLEVTEQARGYFERITDSRGIFGPPAVLKALQERFACFVEVNQFSAARTTADVLLELPVSLLPAFAKDVPEAIAELKQLGAERRTIVCCQNQGELQRFGELLAEAGGGDQAETTSPTPAPSRVESVLAYLNLGFLWGDPADAQGPALAFVPYHELLHRFQTRRRLRAGEGGRTTSGDGRLRAGRALDTFLDFQPGDLVVHRDHGIAKYTGLKLMAPGSARLSAAAKVVQGPANARPRRRKAEEDLEEYLTLEFAGSAKLHVPATKIDQVQRYVGRRARGPPALPCSPSSAASAGNGRRKRSPSPSVTSRVNFCACGPRESIFPASATQPTPPGRRSSRPSSPTRRPTTSSRPSPRSRRTCTRRARWTASSAATWGTARPRSPFARRSRPRSSANRSPCSCPPRSSRSSTSAPSVRASPATPSACSRCRASRRPRK